MKKTQCPTCGERGLFRPVAYAAKRDLDGRRYSAEVPARACPHCGEQLVSGPGMLLFEGALVCELARAGSLGPEGFRWLRRYAGLKAIDLAPLLGVSAVQVSRWENGKQPLERRAVALVSTLALEQQGGRPAALDVLRALAAPKRKVPKAVRLSLPVKPSGRGRATRADVQPER
jgi:hypothetical protein